MSNERSTNQPLKTRESRLRGLLARRGYTLQKFRDGNRWLGDYGRYIVADLNNHIQQASNDLEVLEAWAREMKPCRFPR